MTYESMAMMTVMLNIYLVVMYVVILTAKSMTYPNVMEANEIEIFDLLQNHDMETNPKSRKSKQGKLNLKIMINTDSGAGNCVKPRRVVMSKSEIRESEGSKAGAHYVAANEGIISNEGEYHVKFDTIESIVIRGQHV